MPTVDQLPRAASVNPTDGVIIVQNQGGLPVTLLAEAQQLGTGQAAPVPVLTMAPSDQFFIDQNNVASIIPATSAMSSLGQTVAQLSLAIPASDADLFPVSQGGTALVAQNLAALWVWILTKLPGAKWATVSVSGNVTLDATLQNITLVASGPTTIQAPGNFSNLGDGFRCEVLTQGNSVTFDTVTGVGLTTSTGATSTSAGLAQIRAVSFAGVNQILVNMPSAAGASVPTITIAPISSHAPGVQFTVNGALAGYGAAPTLSYSSDGGATFTAIPPANVTTVSFSFALTLIAGTYSIIVKDANGVSATSNSFNVVTGPALSLNALSPIVSGSSLAASGSESGYVTPPTLLDVSFDAGSTWAVTGLTNTGIAPAIALTIPAASLPPAGSYQMRVRDSNQTTVISASVSLTIETASIVGAPSSGVSGTAITGVTYTLTPGTMTAYAALWNGTADQGSRAAITGASGSFPNFTPGSAGTYTLRIYDAASGGNKLAESANIAVSAGSVNTIIASVTPAALANVGSNLTLNFTYTGSDPTSVMVAVDGGTAVSTSCTATGGSGSFVLAVSGSPGPRPISVQDAAQVNAIISTRFFAQPSGSADWSFLSWQTQPTNTWVHTAQNTAKFYVSGTVHTSGGDVPAPGTGSRLWVLGWSTSPVVPPAPTTGTFWQNSSISTAGSTTAAWPKNYPDSTYTSPWVNASNNIVNSSSCANVTFPATLYLWLQAPSGFVWVSPTTYTAT